MVEFEFEMGEDAIDTLHATGIYIRTDRICSCPVNCECCDKEDTPLWDDHHRKTTVILGSY